ncbi:hypothetical protein [Micromonospora sp. NPDC003241]
MSRRIAARRTQSRSVYSVPVALAHVDLPTFTPTEYVDRPAAGWTVEAVWLAAVRYVRAHELRRGAARAAWLAFSTAYDASPGTPGGAASLRRQEVVARLSGNDPETAAVEEVAHGERTHPTRP